MAHVTESSPYVKVYTCGCTPKPKYGKPWFTADLYFLRQTRDDLYKIYRADPTNHEKYNSFKKARNKYTNQIKKNVKKYYGHKYEEAGGDCSKCWKVTNEITGKSRPTENAIEMIIDASGNHHSNSQDIANIMNHNFATIGAQLNKSACDNIPVSVLDNIPDYSKEAEFDFTPPTPSEVYKILSGLNPKKPTGPDGIPALAYKLSAGQLIKPVTHLFSICIRTKTFPARWGRSFITALYKNKGSKTDFTMYRPITIITPISKAYETFTTEQMSVFLKNRFHEHQYGFRKIRSTQYGVLHATEHVRTSLNKPKSTKPVISTVFLDLSKAFDSVKHTLLLQVLGKMGFSQNAQTIINAYLSNRTSQVKIAPNEKTRRMMAQDERHCHEVLSSPEPVNDGVPQGTKAGPLLYISYTDPILRTMNKFAETAAYADDTFIITIADSYSELEDKTARNLSQVETLYDNFGLKMNVLKTQLTVNPPSMNLTELHVNNSGKTESLQVDEHTTLLGVELDSSLTMIYQIDKVIGKLRSGVAALRAVRDKIPLKIAIQLLNTMFYSHHDYCCTTWHGKTTQSQLNKMETLHRKILRTVYHVGPRYSSKDLYPLANTFTLELRRELAVLQIAHAVMHKLAPTNWHDFIKPTRNKRSTDTMRAAPDRSYGSSFFLGLQQTAVRLWNGIPTDVRATTDPKAFKHLCKTILIDRFFLKNGYLHKPDVINRF